MLKYIQRRSLTFLNTWSGFAFIVILTYALLAYTITLLYYNPCIDSNSNNLYCSKRNYYDNIGNINVESELAYGPIDVGNLFFHLPIIIIIIIIVYHYQ